MMESPGRPPYPVRFDAEYPEQQSRWKALFRLPLAVPALLFAFFLTYAVLFALPPMWLGILIRGRVPRWLFEFQVGANRYYGRVQAYISLLTDVYPAWDGDYPVRYEVEYPERVSRWKVGFWKLATALPQFIAVAVLQFAAFAVVAIGWFLILFTGRFPKGLHQFVVNVQRWRERVFAYALSLTDEFPPYSLDADAPAVTGGAHVAHSAVGATAVAVLVLAVVALIVSEPWAVEEEIVQVSYSRLLAGEIVPGETGANVGAAYIELISALDPADEAIELIQPLPGHRLVVFTFTLTNTRRSSSGSFSDRDEWVTVFGDDFKTVDPATSRRAPILVIVGRRAPPVAILPGETALVEVAFEVTAGEQPEEVSYGRRGPFGEIVVYELQ